MSRSDGFPCNKEERRRCTYVARRTAEGKPKKFIIRCLKRYLARKLYQLLPDTSAAAPPAASTLRAA